MLAAISASHLSPLLSSFSLLYSSSSCVSVENSKLGPCEQGSRRSHVRPLRGASAPASPAAGPAHLNDGVHRAGLLAEATVDALGHVDVVACGPAAAVGPRLSLNGDGLGGGTGYCHLPATLAPGTGSSPRHGSFPLLGDWSPRAYRADPLSSTLGPRVPFLTPLLTGRPVRL